MPPVVFKAGPGGDGYEISSSAVLGMRTACVSDADVRSFCSFSLRNAKAPSLVAAALAMVPPIHVGIPAQGTAEAKKEAVIAQILAHAAFDSLLRSVLPLGAPAPFMPVQQPGAQVVPVLPLVLQQGHQPLQPPSGLNSE